MTYVRGTDNDEIAKTIIYHNGKPLVIAFEPNLPTSVLDDIVLRLNAHEALVKANRKLGMLALQSERYTNDREYREAADTALAAAEGV